MHHFSDCDLSSKSPTSQTSGLLGSNHSGFHFIASSRGNSCSSRRLFSESMSEEDEENVDDERCLDYWEDMADILDATAIENKEHIPNPGYTSPSSEKHINATQSDHQSGMANLSPSWIDVSNAKPESGGMAVQRALVNFRSWRSDDAFRPQSLPNFSAWDSKKVLPVPASYLICFKDLDCTDSSFLPCSCGLMLCLFCHKRIIEEGGPCPCCRKWYHYNPAEEEETLARVGMSFPLVRPCSMIIRS